MERQMNVSVDPNVYYVNNAGIISQEEELILTLWSGAQLRQYAMAPAHAKRIMMLLAQRVEEFEKVHGKIDTSLPKQNEQDNQSNSSMGFQINKAQ